MTTVTILGKLGGDVELKDVNGTALAKFSVAQNVGFGDKKSVNWFSVSIWGGQAKSNFVDYLKKGQMVQVVGVHCRIGSLEVTIFKHSLSYIVHCRIGSLEVLKSRTCLAILVHCRIGSLED